MMFQENLSEPRGQKKSRAPSSGILRDFRIAGGLFQPFRGAACPKEHGHVAGGLYGGFDKNAVRAEKMGERAFGGSLNDSAQDGKNRQHDNKTQF